MKRINYNIIDHSSALEFLDSKPQKKIDDSCFVFNSNNTIYIRLDDVDIITYHPDGTIFVTNNANYNSRFKRYINALSPLKIKQKEFQWMIGDKIFFSRMLFQNNEWSKA